MIKLSNLICILGLTLIISCKEKHQPRYPVPKDAAASFNIIYDSLSNLHTTLSPPNDDDWLKDHPESGQTFKEYIHSKPIGLTATRTKLYLAILGDFDSIQQNMVKKTLEYLSIFYACEAELISIEVDFSSIPKKYFRYNENNEIQVLTDFFLKKLLLENLPNDAFGLIGCTNYDIFPDPQWNFVFGQASLHNRVGVWSMNRLEDNTHATEFKEKTTLRNLKVASHETGHILSLKHCTSYECIMNGSAHIDETDSKPVYLCPICLGKTHFNRQFNLTDRFQNLESFWNRNKISIYHQYYEIVKGIQFSVH